MAGGFHNPPGITFMVILFALAQVIPIIDGTPYKSPRYDSYDDETQPLTEERLGQSDFTMSGAEDPSEAEETAEESKTIHYSESSATYADGRDSSRVLEISEQERATRHGDEERTIHGRLHRDPPEDDDDDDDDDDNHNNSNNTGNTEDEIRQLINAALEDDIFLTPKKWAAWLGADNDGINAAKVDKNRSPAAPHSAHTQTTIQHSQSDRIVFPDEYSSGKPENTFGRPVPICANSTYCLDTPYYPSDAEIENALKLRYLEPISEPSTISERTGPLDEGNGLCPFVVETILPKTAVGDNNEWYYVLNNEKYVQAVRVERCLTDKKPCKLIEGFSSGWKSTCKQKYVYRQFVAVRQSGGPPTVEAIPMPSSCCCHVKFTGDPEMRFGVSSTKINRQSPAPERLRN